MTTSITVQGIYAGICVADFERSPAFYTSLMGRQPDDQPMPGMAQWRNMGAAGLQLWQDADKAGNSVATIVVPDMAAERSRLDSAGLTLEPNMEGDFGIVAQIHDPEGNRINLTEPPKGFVNR